VARVLLLRLWGALISLALDKRTGGGRKKSLLRAFRKVDGVTSFHPYAPEQEQSMIDNLAFSALALPANPLTGH